ncbi:unnamed protein product [Caretta caretta]
MAVPVMLDCGHNYCEDCISQHWGRVEEEEPRQCPLCRWTFQQRSFRQNKLPANMVAIMEQFPSQDKAQDVHSTSSMLWGEVEPMGKNPQEQQVKQQEPSAAGVSAPMARWCHSVP